MRVRGIAAALAALIGCAATVYVCPVWAAEGGSNPDADAVPAAPAAGTASGSDMTGKALALSIDQVGSPALVSMPVDAAKAAFGVSDRNGTDWIDAHTVVADEHTQAPWAVVFVDQAQVMAEVLRLGKPITEPVEAETLTANVVVVRLSEYTQAEVETAEAKIRAIAEANSLAVAFGYNPVLDAIEGYGDPAGTELLGARVDGVAVAYEIGDVGRLEPAQIAPAEEAVAQYQGRAPARLDGR